MSASTGSSSATIPGWRRCRTPSSTRARPTRSTAVRALQRHRRDRRARRDARDREHADDVGARADARDRRAARPRRLALAGAADDGRREPAHLARRHPRRAPRGARHRGRLGARDARDDLSRDDDAPAGGDAPAARSSGWSSASSRRFCPRGGRRGSIRWRRCGTSRAGGHARRGRTRQDALLGSQAIHDGGGAGAGVRSGPHATTCRTCASFTSPTFTSIARSRDCRRTSPASVGGSSWMPSGAASSSPAIARSMR